MRTDARGTVQGNIITLDGAPDLPPGVRVEAVILHPEKERSPSELARAWAEG